MAIFKKKYWFFDNFAWLCRFSANHIKIGVFLRELGK